MRYISFFKFLLYINKETTNSLLFPDLTYRESVYYQARNLEKFLETHPISLKLSALIRS